MTAPQADSNRLLLTYCKERVVGTTPAAPTMQTLRNTGENFKYGINVIRSGEIRPDRLTPNLYQTGAKISGGYNFELSFGTHDDVLESAMFNAWDRIGHKENVVADTQINQVTNSTHTFTTANISVSGIVLVGAVATVTTAAAHGFYKGQKVNIIGSNQAAYNGVKVVTGVTSDTVFTFTAAAGTTTPATGTMKVAFSAAFAAGHLIRTAGFTNAANNGLFKIGSVTITSSELVAIVVAGSPTLTDEAAPPIGASIRVVGFQGAADDINATSTGISSTLLDFTTLGLLVGDWIKIGGGSAGLQFVTVANNDWVRISAISANAMTFDNLPVGWASESSSGSLTIRFWTGSRLNVGTISQSFTFEKSIQSQNSPEYLTYLGNIVNTLALSFKPSSAVTGVTTFMGMSSAVGSTTLSATPTAATTTSIINCVNNVARIAENGAIIANGNAITQLDFTINNQLREQQAVGSFGLVGIGAGDSEIKGTLDTYFADRTLYQKFINNTDSSINARVAINSQAYTFDIQNLTYTDATVDAAGRNQDVFVKLSFEAKLNSSIGNQFQIQRFSEYA